MSSDLESSSHPGQHSRLGRGSVSRGICLPGFLPLDAPLCPVPLGVSRGSLARLPPPPPPGAQGLARASTPSSSRCTRCLRFPSPGSNARLLPPSCPSAGPSLLGPSLPPPSPRPGSPARDWSEGSRSGRLPHLPWDPRRPGARLPRFPSQGECRLPWECVGRTLSGEIQDPPPATRPGTPLTAPLEETHASLPPGRPLGCQTHAYPLSDPHALRAPGPDASGLMEGVPLPAPAPSRQAGLVDTQSRTGRGSWRLGKKAAAPLVPACPPLSSPFLPRPPAQARRSPRSAMEFPGCTPAPGAGGGG